MSSHVDEHPSSDTLRAFAEGRLKAEETDHVAGHVEFCDDCANRVDELPLDPAALLLGTLDGVRGETHDSSQVTQSSAPAEPGDHRDQAVADDQVQLLDVIGSGGMGLVYRALQPALGRHVAVKLLHIPLPQNDVESLRATERFQREIRALGRVRHPHLAQIYNSGVTSEGRLFYSMELIDGANLSTVFRALVAQRDQQLNGGDWHTAVQSACAEESSDAAGGSASLNSQHAYVNAVVEIMRQVALAVQTLHAAGIVHRDIKPGNIMVNAQGDHATLMDLGLAGLADGQETRLTRTGLIAGSLPYVSPEQFRGEPPSQSGDIYNLGAVLWELLTRQRLFQAGTDATDAELIHRILHEEVEPVRRHSDEVSVDLEAVVLKCLEKQPADRYADVCEFIADIDRYLSGQPVSAVRRDFRFGIRSFVKRYRKQMLAAAVLLVCQAALIFAIYQTASNSTPPEQLLTDGQTTTAAIATSGKSAAPVINDGSLVAYWSGEGTGLTVRDNSPNGNNGALIGDASRATGAIGQAFSFDGDGDYINFGRSSKWNFLHDGSSFSVTGFVAPSSTNLDGGILTTIDETSTAELRHGFSLRLDGERRLECHIQGVSGKFPTGAKSETVLPPDKFTAFAITFDGHATRLFINGTLEATGDVVAPFASSTALDALSVGSIGTTSGPNGQPFAPFEGLIDEVQIYDRALSASEVTFLASTTETTGTRSPVIIKVVASAQLVEGAKGGPSPGTDISATHNSRGLGAAFPEFPATHSAIAEDCFLTGSSHAASLHYDFGSQQAVNTIRLWNYHGGIYGDSGNGRGAKQIRVYGSNNPAAFDEVWHDSWEPLTAFTAARAPADGATSPYGEEHRFESQAVRFLRLQIDSNYGGTNVGLAEVQFLGKTSEP